MSEIVVRPLPVPAEVAIRSALLALANAGAELQTYNEAARTIVARMPRWGGLKKSTVMVRVQDYGETCRLELQLPDVSKADEILNQIGLYLIDGHRAASDITMRWVEQRDQGLVQSAGRRVREVFRRPKPSLEPGASLPAGGEDDPGEGRETQLALIDPSAPLATTSASFIEADPSNRLVQINVDPDILADRTSSLETCPSCHAVALRGSQFCPNCGRPITLEAVSTEVSQGSRNAARSSLIFGGLAVAANLLPLFLIFFPVIAYWLGNLFSGQGAEAPPSSVLTPVNILLSIFLGVVPGVLFGNEARRMAKTAEIYLKFRFNKAQEGRSRAAWGRILGWLAIYLGLGWIVFLAAVYLYA
ncbi:MAG: hypothetical protein ACE5H9_05825 [Anaerolineae bacterium]